MDKVKDVVCTLCWQQGGQIQHQTSFKGDVVNGKKLSLILCQSLLGKVLDLGFKKYGEKVMGDP